MARSSAGRAWTQNHSQASLGIAQGDRNARLDEVDSRHSDWFGNHRCRVPLGGTVAQDFLCNELPCLDHRRASAKRQGCGPRRGLWWRRKSDGIWSTWRRYDPFPSYDLVRHHVHDLRPGAGVANGPSGSARRLGAAASLQTRAQEDACNNSGHAGASAAVFCAAKQSACFGHSASFIAARRAAARSSAAKKAVSLRR